MKTFRTVSVVLMVSALLLTGISGVTIADQGPIVSEQGALDALNQQFGSGFIRTTGPGPGYRVSGGEANGQSLRDMMNHDTFGDRINGHAPFPGNRFLGCEGDVSGRVIHDHVSWQIRPNDSLLDDPNNFEQRFEELFGARPVRIENDFPH